MTGLILRSVIVWAVLLAAVVPAAAQQTVNISVPAGMSFMVNDVAATTTGSSTQITYDNPTGFANNDQLRISVQPATSTFAGPGSTRIPASNVSWTATASNGTPSSGSLAFGMFTLVYVSPNKLKKPSTGSVSQTWSLAPVAAAGLRSGTHTLTMVWKFEAF